MAMHGTAGGAPHDPAGPDPQGQCDRNDDGDDCKSVVDGAVSGKEAPEPANKARRCKEAAVAASPLARALPPAYALHHPWRCASSCSGPSATPTSSNRSWGAG